MMILSTSKYFGHIISVELVSWSICIGAILAYTLYFYEQRVIGSIIRSLLQDSTSPENSKNLKDIGKDRLIYKIALKTSVSLHKYIAVVEGESDVDIYSKKMYIDSQNVSTLEKKYRKKPKTWTYVLSIFILLLLGVLLQIFLPMGLEYLENY